MIKISSHPDFITSLRRIMAQRSDEVRNISCNDVAPHAGVWIETHHCSHYRQQHGVAPRVGATMWTKPIVDDIDFG